MEDLSVLDRLWPNVPAEIKYTELRLPVEFRELVANRSYTNEEIGRLVRCIALETEYFITPHIEPDVYHFIEHQKKKRGTRKRVEASRKRKSEKEDRSSKSCSDDGDSGVTVTKSAESADSVDRQLSPTKKTPTILLEKTPPIVPLKKSTPSSLEKKRKKDSNGGVQGDLFDGLSESGQETAQDRSESVDAQDEHQDIESDSRAAESALSLTPTADDSRSDAAWIPQKFAIFWEKYPRKVAKKAAKAAFVKLIKSQNDVDEFMSITLASIEWWKKQDGWAKDGGKFIPHPATWLNRGSWEDSVENGAGTSGHAEFLGRNSDSDDDLIRRMTGG